MTGGGIFQAQDGRQIKFFIQKSLQTQIVSELGSHITENGGRVETKVPIQGYILIDPRSAEGERLIDCWESSERPLRNFVPYTFVAACLDADKLIPQVFRKNGKALKFHIHPSITNEKVIDTLRERIWHSGGHPLASELEADIIIADEMTPTFKTLIEKFDHCHNTYVEGIPWAKQCVESGVFMNTPIVKKNLGGRIAGAGRTEFTSQDDNSLAIYIACRLPNPDMRGRTGNKIYQELIARTDIYPWAKRHSWQSWRERYKNNSARFHKLINTYLEHHPVPESGKGLHGFIRVTTSSPQKLHPKHSESPSKGPVEELNVSEDEWGSQWPIKEGNKNPPSWGKSKRQMDSDNTEESDHRKKHKSDYIGGHEQHTQPNCNTVSELPNQQYPQEIAHMSRSNGGALGTRGQNPAGSNQVIETVENNNEDVISEGDAVGEETQTLLDANKALLTNFRRYSRVTPNSPKENRPLEPDSTNSTVDLPLTPANSESLYAKVALYEIARDFRFLPDEVKEEYEEMGQDLDATRSYFKEIRAWINDKKRRRNEFPS